MKHKRGRKYSGWSQTEQHLIDPGSPKWNQMTVGLNQYSHQKKKINHWNMQLFLNQTGDQERNPISYLLYGNCHWHLFMTSSCKNIHLSTLTREYLLSLHSLWVRGPSLIPSVHFTYSPFEEHKIFFLWHYVKSPSYSLKKVYNFLSIYIAGILSSDFSIIIWNKLQTLLFSQSYMAVRVAKLTHNE